MRRDQEQITARWWRRSTRLILPLASAEAGAFLQARRRQGRLAAVLLRYCARLRGVRPGPRVAVFHRAGYAGEARQLHAATNDGGRLSHCRGAQLEGLWRACNACATKQEEERMPPPFRAAACEKARNTAHPLETI